MELFDTHAHYYSEQFDPDRDALLVALPGQGVTRLVCPGCSLASSRASRDLAERYPFVYFAAGIHPEDLEGAELADLDEVRELCRHPKCVAVGEIGLDYYWVKGKEERWRSRDFFARQLDLARELDLPAIVHDRDAHKDTLDVVRAHPGVRGVFHCCAFNVPDTLTAIDMGWMVSFTGNVTFPTARRVPEVIAAVPLERMMLETDAPYQTPEPYHGQRNHSGYLHLVAEAVARIKGVSVEEVAAVTTQNALEFFGIKE